MGRTRKVIQEIQLVGEDENTQNEKVEKVEKVENVEPKQEELPPTPAPSPVPIPTPTPVPTPEPSPVTTPEPKNKKKSKTPSAPKKTEPIVDVTEQVKKAELALRRKLQREFKKKEKELLEAKRQADEDNARYREFLKGIIPGGVNKEDLEESESDNTFYSDEMSYTDESSDFDDEDFEDEELPPSDQRTRFRDTHDTQNGSQLYGMIFK